MDGFGVEHESLFLHKKLANKYGTRFLKRAQLAGVGVVAFPDPFDLDKLNAGEGAERLFSASSPFGYIDTPLPDHPLTAAAATISGWALDNAGVIAVTAEREPVSGENTEVNERGLIHVAEAYCGLPRSDVGLIYPDVAESENSGWSITLPVNDRWTRATRATRIWISAFSATGASSVLGSREFQFLRGGCHEAEG